MPINRPPSTGKPHLTRSLIQLLRDQGERVTVLAKTHLAAQNVGRTTINHFANKTIRQGNTPTGWIVSDEISMVDAACWAQPCKLAVCGLKWTLIRGLVSVPAYQRPLVWPALDQELRAQQPPARHGLREPRPARAQQPLRPEAV